VAESQHYSGGGDKTVAKTVILNKYLKPYLSILSAQEWVDQTWYVDTHAGTGFTHELGVDIPGSALRALNHNFDRFYYYEKNENHFDLLVETLEDEVGQTFDKGVIDETGDRRAFCEDPRIMVMNMDCNEGVSWLADKGRQNAHWFTFVDPEKFSVNRDLMEQLCRRGNMDILFNFQTEAFYRNGQEAAEHAHEKMARNLGEDFPRDATEDEYVEFYQEEVFGELNWLSASRKMMSTGDNDWRYDLIFASQSDLALDIIGDIYTSDLQNDVMAEIRRWRKESDGGQSGLGSFVELPTEENTQEDDGQSSIGDFI